MRELRLIRLTTDGRKLVVRDPDTGDEFSLLIDSRMRAALRHNKADSGQLEIQMENPLTPREIQTRIRRGESPQQVADSGGISLDQISNYAIPVVAEREHIAERAQGTIVRRKHAEGAPVRLGVAVSERLGIDGRSIDNSQWDAWKREDGKWTVSLTPFEGAETVTYTYDIQGRYVVPDSDRSRELVGDIPSSFSAEMAIADAIAEHPDDILSPLAQPTHAAVTSIKQARDRRAQEQLSLAESEAGAPTPTLDEVPEVEQAASESSQAMPHDVAVNDSVPGAPDEPRKKKPERRRVPSWDEIM
ncbi:MAG: hypothetical protein JWP10_700, partial [Nocardioidaceae bacterium]|nr:hypothetical protein [Nocardioidaceae bacterium]